ncbi:MAG TPA: peptide deformylase [Candidatus Saccharimonadales bacterium]|nr:peptide deformylase [Candidatus Saccharimonadales bacterium]
MQKRRAGLAEPSAPQLRKKAKAISEEAAYNNQNVRRGIKLLESYVDPDGALKAAGMAYPQLQQAALGSLRILAMNVGMPDLKSENLQKTIRTFFDPVVEPIKSEGTIERIESCFSIPGIAVAVKRWKAIMVTLPGQAAFRMDGTDGWIMQHESDHLDGMTCAQLALQQGRRFFYAPEREHRRALAEAGDRSEWPLFPVEQWLAMTSGDFDLRSYARYIQ